MKKAQSKRGRCRSGKEDGQRKRHKIALDRGREKRKEVGPKQKEKKEGGGTEVMWAAERRRSNVKWRGEESDTLEERRRWQKGGQLSLHSGSLEYPGGPPYTHMHI